MAGSAGTPGVEPSGRVPMDPEVPSLTKLRFGWSVGRGESLVNQQEELVAPTKQPGELDGRDQWRRLGVAPHFIQVFVVRVRGHVIGGDLGCAVLWAFMSPESQRCEGFARRRNIHM